MIEKLTDEQIREKYRETLENNDLKDFSYWEEPQLVCSDEEQLSYERFWKIMGMVSFLCWLLGMSGFIWGCYADKEHSGIIFFISFVIFIVGAWLAQIIEHDS